MIFRIGYIAAAITLLPSLKAYNMLLSVEAAIAEGALIDYTPRGYAMLRR